MEGYFWGSIRKRVWSFNIEIHNSNSIGMLLVIFLCILFCKGQTYKYSTDRCTLKTCLYEFARLKAFRLYVACLWCMTDNTLPMYLKHLSTTSQSSSGFAKFCIFFLIFFYDFAGGKWFHGPWKSAIYKPENLKGCNVVSMYWNGVIWDFNSLRRAFGISGLQLQTASTDSFFALSGHGSPPKTSGATVTEHDCFPTQFCRRFLMSVT